jgi:hypothetical protein
MPAAKPTARMKRLYHQLVEHRWGEPTDLIVFERSRAIVRGVLELLHVAIWDADESCGVTSYMTLGMSEITIPHADYRTELSLGVRAALTPQDRSKLAILLANLSEYPFTYDRQIDWWERIVDPGDVPAFPHCPHLLLAPMFGEPAFERFAEPDDDVKVLSVVPITEREGHVLKDHGREAFLDYCEEQGIDIYAPRSDGRLNR